MNKILNISFLAILFAFLLSFLRGGSAEDMLAIEKRELRELPSLENYTLEQLPQAYTDYISDHFPMRRIIMKAASVTSFKLFNAVRSDAVVIGENRFLFLNHMSGTSPRDDYQGTNLFSEEELSSVVNSATQLVESAKQRNQQVIIMIVPNKEEVYSKYLPDSYPRVNDITRRQQVVNQMSQAGIPIIDPTEELLEYSATEDDLYHRADTHWTGKGAYLGAQKLLDNLGIEYIDYSANSFTEGNYYESDIANLCNLYDEYTDTTERDAAKDICIEKNEKTIAVVGDSFSWRLKEYLEESFSQVYSFDHYVDQQKLMETETDILVIQLVERNIGSIKFLIDNCIY